MNYFKILQNLKPLIQSGKLTRIDEALSYLQSAGMKIDGILRKGVENIFKSIKARDPDFNTTVTKMSIDEEGIPFNPNTLKSTPEKRGVENLFEETKRVNMPAEKLNHQMIADQAGIDVELIKGKDWVEILEVLKGLGKADGGRIGFKRGGRGRQDPMGGHAHQTAAEMRAAAPDQFGGGMNISHGGGGDRDGGGINPPPGTKGGGNNLNISPVVTYAGPYNDRIENVGLRGNIGKLMAAGVIDLEDAITTGNIDPAFAANLNLGNFNVSGIKDQNQTGIFGQGNMGPVNVSGTYQDFGEYGTSKNIGASGALGNLGLGVNYDFESNPNVGLSYNDPGGLSGGINYNFQGKPEGMLTFSKKFKKGGRVGYDIGGLTGQAKNIYDSWISAGHPEADVLAYLESRGLYNPQDVGITSIVNTQQPIIPQGDGGGDGGREIINIDRGLKTADDYGSGVYGNNFNDPDVQAEIDALNPGGLKGLIQNLMDLPTPMNLVRKGINKFKDWRTQQNQLAIDAQQKAAAEKIAQAKIAAEEARRAQYGPINYGVGSDGQQSYDTGLGFGVNATTGGPVSNRTGRGRTDWADGGPVGVATMFTRRR